MPQLLMVLLLLPPCCRRHLRVAECLLLYFVFILPMPRLLLLLVLLLVLSSCCKGHLRHAGQLVMLLSPGLLSRRTHVLHCARGQLRCCLPLVMHLLLLPRRRLLLLRKLRRLASMLLPCQLSQRQQVGIAIRLIPQQVDHIKIAIARRCCRRRCCRVSPATKPCLASGLGPS